MHADWDFESDGGHVDPGSEGAPGFQSGANAKERSEVTPTVAIHEACISAERLRRRWARRSCR